MTTPRTAQPVYVYTEDPAEPSDRQEALAEDQVILDFSQDGRLLGVEVLDAYRVTIDGAAAAALNVERDRIRKGFRYAYDLGYRPDPTWMDALIDNQMPVMDARFASTDEAIGRPTPPHET